MRRQADHLNQPAEFAGPHDPQCLLDGRRRDAPDTHRPDASGLRHRRVDGVQLFQGRHAGLVRHDVLATAHRLDRHRGPIPRHRTQHDEIDGRIVEQSVPRHRRHIRKALAEPCQHARVGGVGIISHAFGARLQQALGHVVDMPVIQSDRGETGHPVLLQAGTLAPSSVARNQGPQWGRTWPKWRKPS